MSKITILLTILVVAGCLAIVYFTDFNPISTAQQFIQNPTIIFEWLGSATNIIKQYAGYSVGNRQLHHIRRQRLR